MVVQLDTLQIQKLHYAEKLDFLSQTSRPLIEILCPMNPLPKYIMDETTRIQHRATRRRLRWSVKRPFETSMDHLRLRLPNFITIKDSILVNTAYAFMNNLNLQVKTLFKYMMEEVWMAAGIPRASQGKNFMDWDVIYGNPVRDVNTQTKGLAYWEHTRTNPKAWRKIGTQGKNNGYNYITFARPLAWG